MKTSYESYYTPLVQEFVRCLDTQDLTGLEHMPQPFLPIFGPGYESSRLKLMVMGQDTKGWGNCSSYIKNELESPSSEIKSIFSEMDGQNFTQYGKSTNSFWGFAMALLASIHGVDNWNTMKWGGHTEILSSLAWGNSNAIELWGSLRKHTKGVPRETWNAVQEAGAELTRLKHTLEATKPDVIILTCKSNLPSNFFDGLNKEDLSCKVDYLRHYYIEEYGTHILHTYHPGYMRNIGGPWSFLNRIREYLKELDLAPDFPEFVNDDLQSEAISLSLLKGFRKLHPMVSEQPHKYQAIRWMADELHKHQAFMSVPTAVQILNQLEYKTNRGYEFKGGRGSYKLIKSAYNHYVQAGDRSGANKIAGIFRKPDFTYAY